MINKDGTVVVGQKGKSGRKSARVEFAKNEAIRKAWLKVNDELESSGRKSALYEIAKRQAISKAWEKVNAELEKKDVEKVALPIALKDMITKVGNPDGSKLEGISIYAGQSTGTVQGHAVDEKDIQPDQKD